MVNEWSIWYDVDFADRERYNKSIKELPNQPATYVFRIVGKDGKPFIIQTANGVDEQGIVYIGQAVNLKRRYSGKYSAYDNGVKQCSSLRAIARKVKYNDAFKNRYPDSKFQIAYKIMNDEKSSKELEKELILCYMQKYIHGPLLNSQLTYESDEEYKKDLFSELRT
jgi:hypothetical protein